MEITDQRQYKEAEKEEAVEYLHSCFQELRGNSQDNRYHGRVKINLSNNQINSEIFTRSDTETKSPEASPASTDDIRIRTPSWCLNKT